MLIEPPLSPLSPGQSRRFKKLAWQVVTRFVLSIAGAVGSKLGERAVEWLAGDDDDERDDDPDDGDGEVST